nr:MAG TPA: hypothetical protein [Caudoviricetes sp.]
MKSVTLPPIRPMNGYCFPVPCADNEHHRNGEPES